MFGGSVLSMTQVLFSFISKSLSYIFIPKTTCKGGVLFYRFHLQRCHISFSTVFNFKKVEMKVAFIKIKEVHINFLLPYERKLK